LLYLDSFITQLLKRLQIILVYDFDQRGPNAKSKNFILKVAYTLKI